MNGNPGGLAAVGPKPVALVEVPALDAAAGADRPSTGLVPAGALAILVGHLNGSGGLVDRIDLDALEASVFVGVPPESPAPTVAVAPELADAVDAVENCRHPGDLTQLMLIVDRYCFRWADRDAPIVVVFGSLPAFLEDLDVTAVTRFFQLLSGKLADVGARAYVGIDPDHDTARLGPLADVFGESLRIDDSGAVHGHDE